jgi:hypothetical protein
MENSAASDGCRLCLEQVNRARRWREMRVPISSTWAWAILICPRHSRHQLKETVGKPRTDRYVLARHRAARAGRLLRTPVP